MNPVPEHAVGRTLEVLYRWSARVVALGLAAVLAVTIMQQSVASDAARYVLLAMWGLTTLGLWAAGIVSAIRHPREPVGWIALAIGVYLVALIWLPS